MADLNSMEFKSGVNLAEDKNMLAVGIIKRRMTKEERLRAKERAEAQKNGLLTPDVDANGNPINPHVPKFIADAPWYLADETGGKASLQHQKHGEAGYDSFGMQPSEWYARGQRAGPAATKYRKGACQNCGAMTHSVKDCLERPRKLGAKWTGRDIQADEIIRNFDQSFEGKRDRWNGYDSREYTKIMEEYERVEETRKGLKEAQRKSDAAKAEEDGISDDENKYEYEPDTPGQGYDEKTRTSTRNLRIREDTAKYLLKTGSTSHYDPKSRSMRELPDGSQTVDDSKLQNGKQEFQRASGDAAEFEKLQKFAWQSERAGGDAHLQANPTESEIQHKKLVGQAEKIRNTLRSNILDKYGGVEHLATPPKELLKSTERFVEYTKTGEVIKGVEPPSTKSRYPEDVYLNNHTSVFGSWFRNGKWGYACCHQIHKNSYCTGAQGIEADQAAYRLAKGEIDDMPPLPPSKKEVKQADVGQIRDGLKESMKRKRPDDAGYPVGGLTMTVAESATMSEQEYEDYRKNKMARSDDPLLAMKTLEESV